MTMNSSTAVSMLAILLVLPFAMSKPSLLETSKRALWNFKDMVECETGRSAWDYNLYGCWCGKGGHGRIVDDIDKCCFDHDNCYTAASSICSGDIWTYLWPYGVVKGTCCDCDKSANDQCAEALCRCDAVATMCFKDNEKKWDKKYDNYPQSQCSV